MTNEERLREMTPDDLQRLRELEARATPGPWFLETKKSVAGITHEIGPDQGPKSTLIVVRCDRATPGQPDGRCVVDMRLITALRNAAPALIAAAEERDKRLTRWAPMTQEEAEAAYATAEAAPLSEERIDGIVKFATDPANALDNSQQAQLAAANKSLREQLAKATEERDQFQKWLENTQKAGDAEAVDIWKRYRAAEQRAEKAEEEIECLKMKLQAMEHMDHNEYWETPAKRQPPSLHARLSEAETLLRELQKFLASLYVRRPTAGVKGVERTVESEAFRRQCGRLAR